MPGWTAEFPAAASPGGPSRAIPSPSDGGMGLGQGSEKRWREWREAGGLEVQGAGPQVWHAWERGAGADVMRHGRSAAEGWMPPGTSMLAGGRVGGVDPKTVGGLGCTGGVGGGWGGGVGAREREGMDVETRSYAEGMGVIAMGRVQDDWRGGEEGWQSGEVAMGEDEAAAEVEELEMRLDVEHVLMSERSGSRSAKVLSGLPRREGLGAARRGRERGMEWGG